MIDETLKIRRANRLAQLFIEHGYKCNYGHYMCPIEEHYVHKFVRKAVKLDNKGNPRVIFQDCYRVLKNCSTASDNPSGERYLTKFDLMQDNLVKIWSMADREEIVATLKYEDGLRHNLNDRLPLRGTFSGIARDIWYDNQPIFRITSIIFDPLEFKSLAKIVLTSDHSILYVDISHILTGLSKCAKRKISRYGILQSRYAIEIDNYVNSIVCKYRFHSVA